MPLFPVPAVLAFVALIYVAYQNYLDVAFGRPSLIATGLIMVVAAVYYLLVLARRTDRNLHGPDELAGRSTSLRRSAFCKNPGPGRGSFWPLPGRSHLEPKAPRKSQAIPTVENATGIRPSPCPFPVMVCQKARKTAFSSIYLWQRPFHKHLFMQRNWPSTARLVALTDRSAACVFAGLGVTSRNAVRTGGVFLNGGIGGGAGRAVTVA